MVQVISRAFRILEYIARDPQVPHTLSEITAHVKLNIATTARILETLVVEGYVEQLGRKKGYILGPMSYSISSKGPYRKDVVTFAEPTVQKLAQTTGETVLVAVLRRYRRFVILRIDGTHDIQVRTDTVIEEKVYPTATGRVLFAYASEEERKRFVENVGLPNESAWPGVTTARKLEEQATRIREEGMEINRKQVVGVGVPLWENGHVTSALGLYLPSYRFEGEHREAIVNGLRHAAREISERLSQR